MFKIYLHLVMQLKCKNHVVGKMLEFSRLYKNIKRDGTHVKTKREDRS